MAKSRRVRSRGEGAHGGLGKPSEFGKRATACFGGEEVGEGQTGDGLEADVTQEGAHEEEVGQGGAAKGIDGGG